MLVPIDVIFDSNEVGVSPQVTGTYDNPTFTLLPAIEDCVGIAITKAIVPFTYYVIDETCNQFDFSYNGSTWNNVTVSPGTYTKDNIGAQLVAAIATAGYAGPPLEIYMDKSSLRLVIYQTALGTGPFTITFSNPQRILADILGFDVDSVTSTTATFRDNSENVISGLHNVTGPTVINFMGPQLMYLDSEIGSFIYGSFRNQTSNKNLLGAWDIDQDYHGIIKFNNEDPVRRPMTSSNISRVDLKLTIGNRTTYSVNGKSTPYLQLNGEPFQIGIRFWQHVKEGVEDLDSLGNRTIKVQSNARMYEPKRLKRKDIYK